MALFDEILRVCKNTKKDELMKNHTTFKIGGPADIFCEPEDTKELIGILKITKEHNEKPLIIGNGSDLLVSDKGIRGVVIKIGEKMSTITPEGNFITAGAGAIMSKISNIALKNSLTGFENLSGIPASFGGAIYMNAGAYGTEIADVLVEATVLTADGEIKTLKKEALGYGYRKSIFMQKDYIILSGKIELKPGNGEEISKNIKEVTQKRTSKQPLTLPSAGSAFKRPEGYFAAKLIEESGLKGYTVGGAKISEKHSGFIVNFDNATAKDVLELIKHTKKTVKEKFDVELEPEIKFVGEEMN